MDAEAVRGVDIAVHKENRPGGGGFPLMNLKAIGEDGQEDVAGLAEVIVRKEEDRGLHVLSLMNLGSCGRVKEGRP